MKRLLVLLLFLTAGPAHADGSNDRLFPNGGQRGTTLTLTFPGMASAETGSLLVDGPGVKALGPFVKGIGKIEIAADAEPGIRQVRLVGPKSATAPRPFLVGTLPVLPETEPNDTAAQAQRVEKLPLTLNGALAKPTDIDAYRLTLKRGEWLVAASESRRVGAPTNLALRVRDAAGREVAAQMDYRRRDPWYVCPIPADGEYVIQLSEVTNNMGGGNDDYAYWLSLTTGPWLDYVYPVGARRGESARLSFRGWNLEGKPGPGTSSLDLHVAPSAGAELAVTAGGAPNALSLAVGSFSETEEAEPNEAPEQAQALTAPITVNGTLGKRGDRDCFRFDARKGERYRIWADARELDSFADPVLTLQDASGKVLDSADDAPTSRDPRLLWTAPADGSYRLTVRDLAGAGRGGPQFYYRLSVAPLEPELRLTAAQPTALVRPGAKVELTVSVFQAFQPGAVTVRVEGLPKGVTAEPVSVKPSPDRAQTMQAKLVLTAAADAAPGFAPVRVIAAAGGASPLEAEARWMMTGDGGWGYGTGSTGMLVVLVTPP